ncbi:DUF3077 domain-containing protein [Pseudomonas sp. S75]|nr:DUF3077 domain-containing protein [Pseudomonas sp. S30]MBK0155264.1 DUF3077 domain-containing protein [Pseudomonas sp. S75]
MTDEPIQPTNAESLCCDLCRSGLVSRKVSVAGPSVPWCCTSPGAATRPFPINPAPPARPLLQGDAKDECPALFAVQKDVPFEQAFSELSVMLGCIRHLTIEAEMENDRQAGSAARILSGLAKALIDDLESGLHEAMATR